MSLVSCRGVGGRPGRLGLAAWDDCASWPFGYRGTRPHARLTPAGFLSLSLSQTRPFRPQSTVHILRVCTPAIWHFSPHYENFAALSGEASASHNAEGAARREAAGSHNKQQLRKSRTLRETPSSVEGHALPRVHVNAPRVPRRQTATRSTPGRHVTRSRTQSTRWSMAHYSSACRVCDASRLQSL